MQSVSRLRKILRTSQLSLWADSLRSGKHPVYRPRALEPTEIAGLEANGNFCEDWSLVQVEPGFDSSRIRMSRFQGRVTLPRFTGTLLTPSGISMPTGVYSSFVSDCTIENSLVSNVPQLAKMVIAQGAVLLNCGSVATTGKTSFGAGRTIGVGTEAGWRRMPLVPELTGESTGWFLNGLSDPEQLEALLSATAAWSSEVQVEQGCIGKGAVVCNVGILRNSWIGPHARVDGAAKIRNSTVLSSLETPSEIYDGVILEGCIVQEGVRAHSFVQAKNSIVMRSARMGRKALISSSVIGPCSHIEEAEVTASWLGPLVQAHHHSLLISALWPEGRGNLGYGANVGSNHTGRMPDQEIRPAVGQFLGLGCNIKFPANFSESPFCMIATGTTCAPQRLKLPFALITPGDQLHPGLPTHLNEVRPGWCYGVNAFALQRNLLKYAQRSKGHPEDLSLPLLSPDIAWLVLDTYQRLDSPKRIQELYVDQDIDGIGSNYLRESVRQEALVHYAQYLERFAVDAALSSLEADPDLLRLPPSEIRKLFLGDLLREIYRRFDLPDTVPALVRRWRTLEKRWQERVLHGQDLDQSRGRAIFEDYDKVHPADPAMKEWLASHGEDTARRCNVLLRLLRSTGRSNL